METKEKQQKLAEKQKKLSFTGAFYAKHQADILEGSSGWAHRSLKVPNHVDTRFAIASGSKVFTAVAICLLVEADQLSFDTKLTACLDVNFPYFDKHVTVQHLLTHTAGVPDYFNEEEMDDYEALWMTRPMYHVRESKDFLPLFRKQSMQANVGDSFQYNNAGYILLGLIIEQITGHSFATFVEEDIFRQANMHDSGYFEMDDLPERTALGYIDRPDGTWKTNIYSVPAKGGPDGGAYVTVKDMVKFWQALTQGKLLSDTMTSELFEPREVVFTTENIYYGYSGYMELDEQHDVTKYIQMGYDPGVNFRAVHYPVSGKTIVVCSNAEEGAYEMLTEIECIL